MCDRLAYPRLSYLQIADNGGANPSVLKFLQIADKLKLQSKGHFPSSFQLRVLFPYNHVHVRNLTGNEEETLKDYYVVCEVLSIQSWESFQKVRVPGSFPVSNATGLTLSEGCWSVEDDNRLLDFVHSTADAPISDDINGEIAELLDRTRDEISHRKHLLFQWIHTEGLQPPLEFAEVVKFSKILCLQLRCVLHFSTPLH